MMYALPFYFMRNARFQDRFAACLFMFIFCAGFAMTAPAQSDTFGGNPDTSAFIRIPSDSDDWTRHFRIGTMVGMNIKASFSEKGLFTIPNNNLANGIYDDGYVREDNTGNAFGHTGYWGYNNASQYNASANTLTMDSVTSYSAAGGSTEGGSVFPGFDMAYGDNLWYWKHARVGWELGFGLLPINITDNHPISGATANQLSFTFNTTGLIIPGAPYQGGFNRQGEPTIPAMPVSTTTNTISGGTITGTRSLDVMLYTLRLGPSFYWDLTDHFGMSLGAGPTVGLISGDYKFDETVAGGRSKGQFAATGMVYGGYVNAALMYHLVDNGDFYLGAQYMPMGDATFSGGGRSARLNLDGQLYISIGVNWPF
jgi:hypothetical protein